jgi:hypothetical protein
MTKCAIQLRSVALILVVLGLFAAPAWATQIDFAGIGMGGTWSWNGSGPLSATADGVELKVVGASSRFTIMGCLPPATSCSTSATLFSGQFTGNQGLINGTGSLLFDAPDVSGTVNPGVLSYLGLSSSLTSLSGSFNFMLTGSMPGSLSGSGDLIVGTAAPEPISMALVGTGLLAVGIALRRKGLGLKG